MMETIKLSLEFLKPEECRFFENDNGFLVLELNNENKGRVKLSRSYPFSKPTEYISVSDIDDKEIGILRDINDLDASSKELAINELNTRYFCPTITEIKSIKEKMGHFYFETKIGVKDKNFTVKNITRNIRFAGEDTLLIFDMDGNRYIMPEFSKTDTKSQRLLEPYLY
ncbi:MAG: DUF1854 domain-containing protein, partial [Clostridia bacterium]|nr:DUF1854 domain-containing protein [Clostridia bacterium]